MQPLLQIGKKNSGRTFSRFALQRDIFHVLFPLFFLAFSGERNRVFPFPERGHPFLPQKCGGNSRRKKTALTPLEEKVQQKAVTRFSPGAAYVKINFPLFRPFTKRAGRKKPFVLFTELFPHTLSSISFFFFLSRQPVAHLFHQIMRIYHEHF